MNKRMSLVEGIKRDQEPIDPVVEQNFLKYGTVKPPPVEQAEEPRPSERSYEAKVEDSPLRRARPSKVAPVGLPGLLSSSTRSPREIMANPGAGCISTLKPSRSR